MQGFSGRRPRRARAAATALAAVALALSATSAAAEPVVRAKNSLEPGLVDRINALRKNHGLRPLTVSSALTQAADRHAHSMAKAGYFEHDLYTPKRRANWTAYGTWVRWYWPGPGYNSWSAGENLAWGAPDISAKKTMNRWLNSPPHRANLLTAGWRRVGVSAVHVSGPIGYFGQWADVTIVVAEFGRRS